MKDKYFNRMVLHVEDIKEILGVGYNTAYTLVNNSQLYNFTVYRIGRQIIIPKDEFFRAFNLG